MNGSSKQYPLYEYWSDYPSRDKEYVRWYPPTLNLIEPELLLANIANGPERVGFYLHVPFCKDICPYCPFNKFSLREERKDVYLQAVLKEIGIVAGAFRAAGSRIEAGYFGGGTPTALETPDLLRIIRACLDQFEIEDGAEITIEANPDTVDPAKLAALRDAGINRISFGVQSFNDDHLLILGRTHGADGAYRAIQMAREAGFEDIALDLIYRVPGQELASWERDLRIALKSGVDHISTYCLFLDPGTKLYSATLMGAVADYPDEAAERRMYALCRDVLADNGFVHYTINDFSLPGRESQHHLINWQAPQRSYVGMGPGAFGYAHSGGRGLVYCTIHSLREYAAALAADRLPVRLGQQIGTEEQQARYMVLGLRCLEVRKEPFRRMFGVEMDDVFGAAIDRLVSWGLVTSDAQSVRMTDEGTHFASNVLKAFYTPANRRMPQPIGVELLAGHGASMRSVESSPAQGQPL
jgi:oxygen-independent coproporphyrinogen III oxidase